MKYLLILIIATLVGCNNNNNNNSTTEIVLSSTGDSYDIVKIGNCQYLYKNMGVKEGYLFTHKGDCDNSHHNPVIIHNDSTTWTSLSQYKTDTIK